MSVAIQQVRTGRDLHAFVTLPWRLYRDDPNWVPPLIGESKKLLRPAENPFFEHGEIKAFLARRDGQVVGRIAAIRNQAHEDFHGEHVGFFGFFECENDPEVARALLEAVNGFMRERRLPRVRGPVNPSTNEECGLLIDGFETPPTIMMTHALPYYDALLQSCNLRKAKDLLAYTLDAGALPERLQRGGALAERRNPNVTVRPLDMKRFERDVRIFKTVYNAAWSRNWGFVPMTDREVDHMARQLKPVVDPGLVRIAELDGRAVAFALALPDVNQAIKHANGRLFPVGLLKILWYSRKIDRARVLALGLIPEIRHRGIDVLLYRDLFVYGTSKGYRAGEFSWILEDNQAMRRPMEQIGARVYKTYRIYEADVNAIAG